MITTTEKRQRYERLRESAERKFQRIEELQRKGLICKDGDFVPSVHYPPITQYPQKGDEEVLKGYTVPEDGMIDIYVHIPFCAQRCIFCHYPGKLGPQLEEKKKYLQYLEKEMDIYLNRLGLEKIKPRSILIGGGTPTYLPLDLLEYFMRFFTDRVDMSACKQFNVDLDPNSIIGEEGYRKMLILKKYGVDRLTIGIQSLNDDVLKLMNRRHSAEEAKESVRIAKELGFDVNIEFIYGFPGETFENWVDVIDEAVTLPADEIQIYRLKVQAYGDLQGAIIQNRTKEGKAPIPDFKETMMMKQAAMDIFAENGIHENLRRVHSRQSKIYSHYAYNQCCAQYDQIGFGLTAFSSFRDRFALNTQYFEEYYGNIDKGILPISRGYIRDEEQQLRWHIVLPMKNTEVKKADFKRKTGKNIEDVFVDKQKLLIEEGLLEYTDKTLTLTELGKFVADEVVEQFNSVEYLPFPKEHYDDGILNPYYHNTTADALGN